MPQRTVPQSANEYYHVYNRGNNRQVVSAHLLCRAVACSIDGEA